MKNKLLLSILAAFGLAGASSQAQTTTFVDVATLGEGVQVLESGGSRKVNATLLTKNQRWTRDRVYVLANNVIVNSGVTLTIEAGTLIRAERPTLTKDTTTEAAANPADPGALIAARGGKIVALGTADAPIIMTSIDDPHVPGGTATIPPYENKGVAAAANVLNPERVLRSGGSTTVGTAGVGLYNYTGGSVTADAFDYDLSFGGSESIHTLEGLWGGIVLAGHATVVKSHAANANARSVPVTLPTINVTTGAASGAVGIELIEGMAAFPTYSYGGGDDDGDNSGALRFVEVRYGGYVIINGKELNSFSCYGVGKDTVLEFLADWNNADDSFEFWGGAAGVRWGISCFPGDDGLDTDQGYLGANQFYVQMHNNGVNASGTLSTRGSGVNIGDSVTENDGPEGAAAFPFSIYTLANATLIGRGYNSVAVNATEAQTGPNYKDGASAHVYNSIIMDSPNGAILVMDKLAAGTAPSTNGASAINRFTSTRTAGGFDGAGKAADLTSDDSGAASKPDGFYSNVWFYRCGLLDSGRAGVNGKYASLADLTTAIANDANVWTASDENLFPDGTDRSERGASSGVLSRANTTEVIAQLKANGNTFNTDPGLTVPYNHRLSGIDLRVNATAAKDLGTNSILPSYRGINNDATFVGAVRNNMWMRGWTMADRAGLFDAGALAIDPEVVVTANSANKPVITFGGDAGVKYVIEVSTDNKTYTKVQTVSASAGNNTVTDTARTVGSTPLFYRVIAL